MIQIQATLLIPREIVSVAVALLTDRKILRIEKE